MQTAICKKKICHFKVFLQKQIEKETPRIYWKRKQSHVDCSLVAGYSVQVKNESVFDKLP